MAVAVAPRAPAWAVDAVRRGGGTPVPAVAPGPGPASRPPPVDGVVWLAHDDAGGLEALLAAVPGIRWVQLPSAGVDVFAPVMSTRPGMAWASASGVTAEPVAEMAVALLLAGRRGVVAATRLGADAPRTTAPVTGERVVVVGAGAVGRAIARRLVGLGADVHLVRRSGGPVPELPTVRVWPASALAEALADAAGVVLALPLTPATDGLIGVAELAAMGPGAWLVNVARGRHVRTDDLVAALQDGVIAGAALDVTDPEPLAPEHPLRRLPNCVVTPHIGYGPGQVSGLLADRIAANVRRAAAGEPLLGSVDPGRGY